jgi:Domain of unknown function (DUF4136)
VSACSNFSAPYTAVILLLLTAIRERIRRTARNVVSLPRQAACSRVVAGGCMKNAVVAVAVVMTTAVLYAQKVSVDADPAAPFATYKTYAWVDGTPAPSPLNEDRLQMAVDTELSDRGVRMNTTDPDLIVTTHVTTNERQELVVDGFRPGRWDGSTAQVQAYVDGTLVVDLYDAHTKKMVWRGVATATASDKPTKNAGKINKVLDKMFEKFPIPTQAQTH